MPVRGVFCRGSGQPKFQPLSVLRDSGMRRVHHHTPLPGRGRLDLRALQLHGTLDEVAYRGVHLSARHAARQALRTEWGMAVPTIKAILLRFIRSCNSPSANHKPLDQKGQVSETCPWFFLAIRTGTYFTATPFAIPAASRSASALSVRSQVKSRSSRPKWP